MVHAAQLAEAANEKKPAPHRTGGEIKPLQAQPAGHTIPCAEPHPAGQNRPGGALQLKQEATLVWLTKALKSPAGHSVHADAFGALEKLPIGTLIVDGWAASPQAVWFPRRPHSSHRLWRWFRWEFRLR